MFKKIGKKTKSPMISRMIPQFNNEKKLYMNQTVNNGPINNNYYNKNTLSQSNASFLTASQLLDYTLVNDEIKRQKTIGILDVTSHRNKDIFIETDSEQFNSRRNSEDSNMQKRKRGCSKLIVDKVTSHIPNTYSLGKGKNKIPIKKNKNKYSIKTFRTFKNNFNISQLSEINDDDEYEYEKSEIIRIKKINYIPTTNPNERGNNKFNNKKVFPDKIGNMNKRFNKNNNIDKENDLKKKRRTNNLSYSSNPLNSHKYPFSQL